MQSKVLIVCGPAAGGILRHVRSLLDGLPALGVEAALAAPLPEARFPFPIGDRPHPVGDLLAVQALRHAAREWHTDLVHAHGVKAALLAAIACPQSPLVVTLHNLWSPGNPWWLRTLAQRLFPRIRTVIAVSNAVADSFRSARISLPRVTVIPNGLDPCDFSPRKKAGTGKPFTIAFVGRLTEEKGIDVLLEARRPAGSRLMVAGDGPLRSLVEGSTQGLDYLGYLADPRPLYREADIVVVPSLSEGFGLVALEAMACGLPVVASNVGGLQEVVADGETGVLVPSGDARALAKAMADLAADPDRRQRLGAAGRCRVEEHFTRERMLARVADAYQAVRR